MPGPTPVAVYGYNRPKHLERLLTSLWNCRRREECSFHFFADGPKSDAHHEGVLAARSVLHDWAGRFGATVTEREQNLGLARSITGGVSDLCERFGRVIVVEDDLILAEDFLHFMIEALSRYQGVDSVLQVGGCTLAPPPPRGEDAFILPVTTTWGWATWARAWKHFDPSPALEELPVDPDWEEFFNIGTAATYTNMLKERMAGLNDSWGILWWLAVARRRGLVVYPCRTLVLNGGFDGSGVHCGTTSAFGNLDPTFERRKPLPDELRFPASSDYRSEDLDLLKSYLRQITAEVGLLNSQLQGVRVRSVLRRLQRLVTRVIR